MRRLSAQRLRRDDGAVAVIVALLMVALLGFAAVSVDVGANYAERRQLQNGADAAALAVAQESACQTSATPTTTAQTLAQANVNDGLATGSAVIDQAVGTVEGKVTATVSAVDASGAPGRRNWFAPVLGSGFDHTQVSASATAGCGHPLAGTAALPLTFNQCHFTSPTHPGTPTLIGYNTTATDCAGFGNVVPGNFGWLTGAGGGCPAQISAAVYQTAGTPGSSIPPQCKPLLANLQNTVALLPIYDQAGATGSSSWFHIIGFAAFKITGYRFSGNPEFNWQNTGIAGQPSCTGNCRGIIGSFVNLVGLDAGFTMGGTDFGVTLVTLIQ